MNVVWLAPLAWIGAAAAVLPILVHVLVQRRARPLPFPTLRFLPQTRVAAIRRHRLDDRLLLAVRIAAIVTAAAALAGPLMITSGRRAAWNERVVQAFVGTRDDIARAAALIGSNAAGGRRDFEGADVRDDIARAAAWLETVPPSRREIVVAGSFPQGSVDAAAFASVSRDVGIRLVRTSALPSRATLDGGLVASNGMLRRRTIELDGPSTSVADRDAGGQPDLPVRVIAHPSVKPAIDAAIAAVRSGTIPAASAGRARLLIASALLDPAAAAPAPVRAAWIADALATLSQDAGVQRAAARVSRAQAPIDFSRQPWHALARGADGRVIVAGAGADGDLLVASAAPADDLLTPVLLRAICDALAPAAPVAARDILPTADEDLRAWERPPQPVVRPRLDTVVDDDRRWMWTATLALLAIETWMRRSRRRDDGQIAAGEENRARVA